MKRRPDSRIIETITDKDRLYVLFAMSMSNEHFDMYAKLPVERRDYLFSLWVMKNHPDKVQK